MKLKQCIAIMILGIFVTTTVFAASYTAQAENLQRLGLFRGTENGHELESTFTRAQGATMLVRLLGMEQTALAMTPQGIFRDVPADDWAAPYIEYCYQNGITKGTSETTYSPEDAMSGSEYLTLVLRALGYQYAEPENAHIPAAEYGLVSSKTAEAICQATELLRDTMVYISYQALSVKQADGQMLIEELATKRAVDTAVARQIGLLE